MTRPTEFKRAPSARPPAGKRALSDPIYIQVVQAIDRGCETSREIGAELRMQTYLVRAHLAVARKLGMIEAAGEFHYSDSKTPAIRWRAVK